MGETGPRIYGCQLGGGGGHCIGAWAEEKVKLRSQSALIAVVNRCFTLRSHSSCLLQQVRQARVHFIAELHLRPVCSHDCRCICYIQGIKPYKVRFLKIISEVSFLSNCRLISPRSLSGISVYFHKYFIILFPKIPHERCTALIV